jgi:hypothetical protein
MLFEAFVEGECSSSYSSFFAVSSDAGLDDVEEQLITPIATAEPIKCVFTL